MKTTERTVDLSIHHTADAIHAWTVTGWYETDQLPVRSGVYEVTMAGDGRFSVFRYFDGVNWYEGGGTPNEALHHFQTTGHRADVIYRWRGLTKRAT